MLRTTAFGLALVLLAGCSADESMFDPVMTRLLPPTACPDEDPDCEERAIEPDEMVAIEQAIRSKSDCPEIQGILLDNLSRFLMMQADDSPLGWTEGEADNFTIWIHEDHWAHSSYLETLLPETLYHEGAHALVGSNRGHDSVWEDAFSCYAS